MLALLIGVADQSAVAFPVSNYPELAELSPVELERLTIGFGCGVLCLDERDLHVSIAARNGSRSSAAKALAARKNGRKGGRPRKLAAG